MNSTFIPDTKGLVSATKVQDLTTEQQEVARDNIDAEQSVVDCTKAPFNCDPSGVADSTAGLNAFFAYISANDVGTARCNGTFLISNTINIGPSSGDMATKLIEGAMRVVSADATIGTVLLFRYMRDLVWKGIVKVEGWGNTSYASRKNATGVKFSGVNACNFDGFVVSDMQGDGVSIDSTGVIPSYNNTIGIVWANNCGSTGLDGSVGVDQTTISGTWSARSDTGSSGGFDQRSTITLSNLPPASVDDLTKTILINDTPYIVKSINRGASTATIYPWINPIASTSGTYKFIFGAGVRTFGTEVAGNTIHHLSPTLCGYGLSVESLYGTTVGVLQTHGCGAGMSVGGDVADALLGTHVARYYGEDINKFEFILRTLGAQSVTLSSMAPAEVDKIRTCCAPFVTAYSAPSSVYNNFPGCSFGLKDDPVITFKPINNSESLDGAAFLDISTEKHVGYYGNNFTVSLVLADTGFIQYLGQDTFSFHVFGSGTNGSPTGTITINPPTGWKINGGTINAAATFSSFDGPAAFAGYMQLADMNIVLGKVATPINSSQIAFKNAANTFTEPITIGADDYIEFLANGTNIGFGGNNFFGNTTFFRTSGGVSKGSINGNTGDANFDGYVAASSFFISLTTPASSSAAGSAGAFTADANYLYFCTAPNTWKRVAISTW